MEHGVKGTPEVLAALNQALKNELTAIHQYLKHGHLLADWGFTKRSQAELEEAQEEKGHADRLAERILLLGGEPDLESVGQTYIGKNLREVIENDLKLELEAIAHYRQAIRTAEAAFDYVTRDLLIALLADEEQHQDHYRIELDLIEQIGFQNFAQLQV
ncbi:bacterioferritin [Benzoatithermus flavus]|uniref:Bacterioferritin n=1 Tax=Benzoatithermus flavus TaxID=3108223 RepID=A0ABU8XM45_9PROT